MSTAASASIEDMAAASDGHKWFQLYWPMKKDDDITISMLQRAQKAGVEVLVVTLDLWALSWRPADLDNAYVPFFLGIGDQIGCKSRRCLTCEASTDCSTCGDSLRPDLSEEVPAADRQEYRRRCAGGSNELGGRKQVSDRHT